MPRHQNKEIEAALQYAEAHGWEVVQTKHGHNWGYMICGHHERDGCRKPIFSTPRNPQNHAKKLRKEVDDCSHA